MKENYMKIISIEISRLYGIYDYCVNFNKDVTFIYGSNGCGKTTVLNITEAIITGQLFKLSKYSFGYVELKYSKKGSAANIKSIMIENKKEFLEINFNQEKFKMEKELFREEARNSDRDFQELIRLYFNKFDFLNEIKRTFNYVYLPLNRSAVIYDEEETNYYMSRRMRSRIPLNIDNIFEIENRDLTMLQIEHLINSYFSRINSEISKINDDFRNQILKSLLEINSNESVSDSLTQIISRKNSVKDLDKTKSAYLKMLKDLNLLSDEEEINYSVFFSTLSDQIEEFNTQGQKRLTVDLVSKFQDYTKIKKLITIAENTEKKKSKEREPIELFINTMNEFIADSDDGKLINIDTMGRVFFTTKYSKRPISIQYLSSGEKQLITFFANLIFKVKKDTSGIFVVDEPELSLHLSWQKIFVEKTLEINKNIQLVFATHAPEIIGNKTDKAFRLVKQYKEGVCTDE